MPTLLDDPQVTVDPVLAPLLNAPDDESAEAALERLLVEANSLIRRIVVGARSSLQQDMEDVTATINLRLVRRLRRMASVGTGDIARFSDFVATLSYHTIYDFVRIRFPQRVRLKNRIRYVLGRDPRLAIWNTPAGPCGGLREWSGGPASAVPSLAGTFDRRRLADALVAVFEASRHPLLVDDVVDVLAECWGVCDRPAPFRLIDGLHDDSLDARLTSRDSLDVLWQEIRVLRPPQRAALLLNLRDADSNDALVLLVMLDIASFDAVADALEIRPERLAELWKDLPLNDETIAAMLGVTRQQVINLRKAARARLARRMAHREGAPRC